MHTSGLWRQGCNCIVVRLSTAPDCCWCDWCRTVLCAAQLCFLHHPLLLNCIVEVLGRFWTMALGCMPSIIRGGCVVFDTKLFTTVVYQEYSVGEVTLAALLQAVACLRMRGCLCAAAPAACALCWRKLSCVAAVACCWFHTSMTTAVGHDASCGCLPVLHAGSQLSSMLTCFWCLQSMRCTACTC